MSINRERGAAAPRSCFDFLPAPSAPSSGSFRQNTACRPKITAVRQRTGKIRLHESDGKISLNEKKAVPLLPFLTRKDDGNDNRTDKRA